MAPRAFVSFEMEDVWARNFLGEHARDERVGFEFIDYSVKEPFESKWKTNAKARIGLTRGTIVLIGATTNQSEAVLWEIAETKRQGHPLFGIQTRSGKTYTLPSGIPSSRVVRWDFDTIKRELARW